MSVFFFYFALLALLGPLRVLGGVVGGPWVTRSTCFWACRMLNFYCSCFLFFPFIAGGRSASHLRLLVCPFGNQYSALGPPLQPQARPPRLRHDFSFVSFPLRLASALTFTLFDFSHMSYQRLFPRGLCPLAAARCCPPSALPLDLFAVFRIYFAAFFAPFFSAARDFQRMAAGVIALSLAHRLTVWQALSSFRLNSYYFAFKNRFAFVYIYTYIRMCVCGVSN